MSGKNLDMNLTRTKQGSGLAASPEQHKKIENAKLKGLVRAKQGPDKFDWKNLTSPGVQTVMCELAPRWFQDEAQLRKVLEVNIPLVRTAFLYYVSKDIQTEAQHFEQIKQGKASIRYVAGAASDTQYADIKAFQVQAIVPLLNDRSMHKTLSVRAVATRLLNDCTYMLSSSDAVAVDGLEPHFKGLLTQYGSGAQVALRDRVKESKDFRKSMLELFANCSDSQLVRRLVMTEDNFRDFYRQTLSHSNTEVVRMALVSLAGFCKMSSETASEADLQRVQRVRALGLLPDIKRCVRSCGPIGKIVGDEMAVSLEPIACEVVTRLSFDPDNRSVFASDVSFRAYLVDKTLVSSAQGYIKPFLFLYRKLFKEDTSPVDPAEFSRIIKVLHDTEADFIKQRLSRGEQGPLKKIATNVQFEASAALRRTNAFHLIVSNSNRSDFTKAVAEAICVHPKTGTIETVVSMAVKSISACVESGYQFGLPESELLLLDIVMNKLRQDLSLRTAVMTVIDPVLRDPKCMPLLQRLTTDSRHQQLARIGEMDVKQVGIEAIQEAVVFLNACSHGLTGYLLGDAQIQMLIDVLNVEPSELVVAEAGSEANPDAESELDQTAAAYSDVKHAAATTLALLSGIQSKREAMFRSGQFLSILRLPYQREERTAVAMAAILRAFVTHESRDEREKVAIDLLVTAPADLEPVVSRLEAVAVKVQGQRMDTAVLALRAYIGCVLKKQDLQASHTSRLKTVKGELDKELARQKKARKKKKTGSDRRRRRKAKAAATAQVAETK